MIIINVETLALNQISVTWEHECSYIYIWMLGMVLYMLFVDAHDALSTWHVHTASWKCMDNLAIALACSPYYHIN